jgi:hypothetical protein
MFCIEDSKITRYLLSTHTPKAVEKNAYFTSIGYSYANWTLLRDHLLEHPRNAQFESAEDDVWGMKHLYRCLLPPSPDGRQHCIRSIWQLRRDDNWWFITAVPRQPL